MTDLDGRMSIFHSGKRSATASTSQSAYALPGPGYTCAFLCYVRATATYSGFGSVCPVSTAPTPEGGLKITLVIPSKWPRP